MKRIKARGLRMKAWDS